MIRGFVAKFSRQRLLARQCRLFAAETAPALGRTEQASEGGVMRYVNGELVKRNELALKKTEDIEG